MHCNSEFFECRISLCVHCWSTRLHASLICGSSCFLRVFRSFGGIEWSLGVFGLGYGAVLMLEWN